MRPAAPEPPLQPLAPPTVEAEEGSGELEVLTAVIAGSTDADWPASPITRRTRADSDLTSIPATHSSPPSRRTKVASADEGRLSRTARAKQGGDLDATGNELATIQRRDFVEALAQPATLDDRRHRLNPSSWNAGISLLSEREPLNRRIGRRIGAFTMYDKTDRANVTPRREARMSSTR
jgi:hypothetical protein